MTQPRGGNGGVGLCLRLATALLGGQDPRSSRGGWGCANGEAGPFLECSLWGEPLPRMHCSRRGPTLGGLCRCQHQETRVPLSPAPVPSVVGLAVTGMMVEMTIIYYLF